MKQLVAVSLVVPALAFVTPAPARADAAKDAALALGSFAVLNQLVRGETILHDLFGIGRPAVRETVVVQPAPVVVAPPPAVVYAPAPPPRVLYAPAPPPKVVYVPAPPPKVVYKAPRPTVVYAAPPTVIYAPGPPHGVPPGHAKRVRGHHYYRR